MTQLFDTNAIQLETLLFISNGVEVCDTNELQDEDDPLAGSPGESGG